MIKAYCYSLTRRSRKNEHVTLKEFIPWKTLEVEATIDDDDESSSDDSHSISEVRFIFYGTTSGVVSFDNKDLLLSLKEATIFAEG